MYLLICDITFILPFRSADNDHVKVIFIYDREYDMKRTILNLKTFSNIVTQTQILELIHYNSNTSTLHKNYEGRLEEEEKGFKWNRSKEWTGRRRRIEEVQMKEELQQNLLE